MKSAGLYRLILLVWVLITAAAAPSFGRAVARAAHAGIAPLVLTVACTMLVAAFWLNGVKDAVYAIVYRLRKSTLLATPRPRADRRWRRVVLVYCTCNDFDPDSLRRSMCQTYPGVQTVILDDSTDASHRSAVDEFAAVFDVAVHRRPDRAGFKAGNLNNFLTHASFDYFVILDSDEIIPPDFVDRALDYFAARPDAGIVQATHVATRNRNPFMRMFAAGVDAHWPAYQAMKDRYGFLSLLGHGAMVSRACYQAAVGSRRLSPRTYAFRSAPALPVFSLCSLPTSCARRSIRSTIWRSRNGTPNGRRGTWSSSRSTPARSSAPRCTGSKRSTSCCSLCAAGRVGVRPHGPVPAEATHAAVPRRRLPNVPTSSRPTLPGSPPRRPAVRRLRDYRRGGVPHARRRRATGSVGCPPTDRAGADERGA